MEIQKLTWKGSWMLTWLLSLGWEKEWKRSPCGYVTILHERDRGGQANGLLHFWGTCVFCYLIIANFCYFVRINDWGRVSMRYVRYLEALAFGSHLYSKEAVSVFLFLRRYIQQLSIPFSFFKLLCAYHTWRKALTLICLWNLLVFKISFHLQVSNSWTYRQGNNGNYFRLLGENSSSWTVII